MVSEKIVFFLFRWGQFFADAAVSIIDQLTTPFGELYPDSFMNFLVLGMSLVLDTLGLDILEYSPLDLLIGPGMGLLLAICLVRFLKL